MRSIKSIKNNSGQTLVESAIVLALFLALTFGIIEFGRAWFYSNHLNNSVRAAARYAAVLGNRTGTGIPAAPALSLIQTYAEREITSYIKVPSDEMAGLVSVNVTKGPGNSMSGTLQRGDTVTVTADLPFHVLTGGIVGSIGDFTMVRSASMRFE